MPLMLTIRTFGPTITGTSGVVCDSGPGPRDPDCTPDATTHPPARRRDPRLHLHPDSCPGTGVRVDGSRGPDSRRRWDRESCLAPRFR